MGMGFAIIIDKSDIDDTIKTIKNNSDIDYKIVGEIKKGKGVSVPSLGINY
jgi:phosphoribosylaminoimidazole (AIR) synthetase